MFRSKISLACMLFNFWPTSSYRCFITFSGDVTTRQGSDSGATATLQSQTSRSVPPISSAASSLTDWQATMTSSARTSAELHPPMTTTTRATVQQSIAGISPDQPGVLATSKITAAEYGAGDGDRVTGGIASSQIPPVTSVTGSRGDTGKPAADVSTSGPPATSLLPPVTGASTSASSESNRDAEQSVIHSSSSALPPNTTVSLPTAQEGPSVTKTAVETMAMLPASLVPPSVGSLSTSVAGGGTLFSLSTSFTPVGEFTPVFGAVSQHASSVPTSLTTVIQPPVQAGLSATSAAIPQPQTQPARSVSSANPPTFGVFASQPSVFSTMSSSKQSVVTAPAAAVSFASVSGIAAPSSAQATTSSFAFSLKADTVTTSAGSNIQNFGKDKNMSYQFGSFPTQPSLGSATGVTSSFAGVTPSSTAFGKSQQPFQPVFGNPDSQRGVSGFGSFQKSDVTSAAAIYGSQQITAITDKQSSMSGAFQASGNQSASGSFGSFAGGSTPFGSSAGVFGASVSKTDSQPVSSTFNGFATASSNTSTGGSAVFGGMTVTQSSAAPFSSFPAVSSAGGAAFGSSSLQPGASIFGTASVPAQPAVSAFGSFTGTSAGSSPFGGGAVPAFGSSAVQPATNVFGSSSAPVFNGMPPAFSAASQSLPNGCHSSTVSATGLFTFAGKTVETASGAASPITFSGKSDPPAPRTSNPFIFGQSASNVNGFPASASVPTFGVPSPATPFTFGKLSVYYLGTLCRC